MYTIQFYESYNKPDTQNPNIQNNDINVGFTTNTKFVLLQLRQCKFWSIHTHIATNFKKFKFNQFGTFHPSPICTFHWSRKTCTWLDEQFRTFHPSLHESVTLFGYNERKMVFLDQITVFEWNLKLILCTYTFRGNLYLTKIHKICSSLTDVTVRNLKSCDLEFLRSIIFAAVSQKRPFRKISEISLSSEAATRMHFSISLFGT